MSAFDRVMAQRRAKLEAECHAATNEGIARVAAGANDEWKALMYGLVVKVAERQPKFISDDVFALLDEIPSPPETTDKRAFGHIMRLAQKNGICSKANEPAIPSQRKNIHRSLCAVWQSHIYQVAA